MNDNKVISAPMAAFLRLHLRHEFTPDVTVSPETAEAAFQHGYVEHQGGLPGVHVTAAGREVLAAFEAR